MSERGTDDGGSQMTPATPTPPTPQITGAVRAQAREHPGEWAYAVDPEFENVAQYPPQAIMGAWHADEHGDVSEDFTANPNYVPSPTARGWSRPTSRLERVLQLVRAGHAPGEDLDKEFAEADVIVYSRPEGGLFVAKDRSGGLVYAFTDGDKAAASGYDQFATMSGRDLAVALPAGVRIGLNPGSDVSVAIAPADIVAVR